MFEVTEIILNNSHMEILSPFAQRLDTGKQNSLYPQMGGFKSLTSGQITSLHTSKDYSYLLYKGQL